MDSNRTQELCNLRIQISKAHSMRYLQVTGIHAQIIAFATCACKPIMTNAIGWAVMASVGLPMVIEHVKSVTAKGSVFKEAWSSV